MRHASAMTYTGWFDKYLWVNYIPKIKAFPSYTNLIITVTPSHHQYIASRGRVEMGGGGNGDALCKVVCVSGI